MDSDHVLMNCQIKFRGKDMRVYVVAAMLTAQLALAAPAPAVPAPRAQQDVPVIAQDWAAPPAPDKSALRRVIKESIAAEKALAMAQSKDKAIPVRFTASSQPDQDEYEKFADGFHQAKVPGCLGQDGLKRQPTFFLGGLLAIPFIAVAAIRGKCN